MDRRYDLAVIGAGSGGIGAALAAARAGLSVLLIEQADAIGGTAGRCGVNMWEPSAGGTGLPFEIYLRLKQIPGAVAVYSFGRHRSDAPPRQPPWLGGEHVIDPSRRYVDTLCRHGALDAADVWTFKRETWHGVVFEPSAYVRVVGEMLDQTAWCTVATGESLAAADVEDGRVQSLRLDSGRTVEAGAYVDCTGDVVLCRACGCETMLGQDPASAFQEPGAPELAIGLVNGVTLIFRVAPVEHPAVEPLESGVPEACWWADEFGWISAVQYPDGGYNVNMLPTMAGREYLDLGPDRAYAQCRRRVLAYWHHLQTRCPEWQRFRLSWIAPALGVRESHRVVGEAVLTQHDLLAGLDGQDHDDIIAIADHAMDVHGGGPVCGELAQPYGVPYRCLVPRGFSNLLVTCRGASFSFIAASSCRLSRTMMHLGQAAGTAAALAKREGLDLAGVPADALRDALRTQHVQLDWPTPPEITEHLQED